MRDDVHGRDVGGEDDEAGRRDGWVVHGGGGGERGFADGFHDFFHAAFEGFVFGGLLNPLQHLLLVLLVAQWVRKRHERTNRHRDLHLAFALLAGLALDQRTRGFHRDLAVLLIRSAFHRRSVQGLPGLLVLLLLLRRGGGLIDFHLGRLALLVLLLLLLFLFLLQLDFVFGGHGGRYAMQLNFRGRFVQ